MLDVQVSSLHNTQPRFSWQSMFIGKNLLCKIFTSQSSSNSPLMPQAVELREDTCSKRLYSVSENVTQVNMNPGIHYLPKPPQSGYLIQNVKTKFYKLITPLDFLIQRLYQSRIYQSYDGLKMSDIHKDIRERMLPEDIKFDPARPDTGLHAFSIIASTGTIDEWRGQEDDDRVPPLESFYSINNDKALDGFVLFGKKAGSANDYYVAQMGTAETGKNLGTNLMTKIIDEVKSRTASGEKTKLFVATRHGNEPAMHLYENKLGFSKINAADLGLSNDRFQGYELEIKK